ncbi:MAG: type II toxin-antitoxin system RelE/ParE family toxin [Prolixibacteraceae bacterium]|nr:type II toxin-antitoxin system RelE/ParE family toxin [Prolixibacteraceae bacterium]
MKIEYAKNKLEKQLGSMGELKKAFGVNAKRIGSRLDDIEASPNLAILMQIPAANCHPLTGDRKGEWAVDVSGNYRLIFKIQNNPIPKIQDGSVDAHLVTDICILEIVDYH